MHYMRMRRRGTTAATGTAPGAIQSFLKSAIETDSRDCLLWPYATTPQGYGSLRVNKKTTAPHRVVAKIVYGPAKQKRMEVAHSCGNKLCVNPKHLRWATREENQADRVIHGTSNRGERQWKSKLTREDVLRIRNLSRQGMSSYKICETFSVASKTIRDIVSKKRWAWLD